MNTSLLKRFTVVMLVLFATAAFAQGRIRGVVSDSVTMEALIGANVYILGTALGSATDLEGEYRIERVPPGMYTLRISYIGYRTKDLPVRIEQGKTIEISAKLTLDVYEGASITVTAQAEGQAAAINQQITSNTIINVVSEEKIQELPDANAAESIGRLPGVSVQRSGGEANKIVLRGLSDKFSTITVDGVRLAPTDPDARGVDLSTISQGSLAGVELYKALTPDKDADAIAGAVNLVTKKAPDERFIRADLTGSYNEMDNSYDQYDFTVRYGERFFNDVLGIQFSGNVEKRDRSREQTDFDCDVRTINDGKDYAMTNIVLNYTDEIRKRQGFSALLDINTPDGGTIRINNIYNKTNRDFIDYQRNYPLTGDNDLEYSARDREQKISTFNSLIRGENYFWGLKSEWSASYARSESDYPFDFEITFLEPSEWDSENEVAVSGMGRIDPQYRKGPPEKIISYAVNNFEKAYLNTAFFRDEKNDDTEKTAYLNLERNYSLNKKLSGTLKIGGKYRSKSRSRSRSELFSPYYVQQYRWYTRLADGTVVEKQLAGSFDDLQMSGGQVLVTNFLGTTARDRDIYDKYQLYPLINRDALRDWWRLNKSGVRNLEGQDPEFERNLEPDATYYDIDERVAATYLMNTLNLGQDVTFIAGVRVEQEDNDYASRYSPGDLSGFPVPKGSIRDTSAVHKETVVLPNFHLTFRPTGFMNIRLAAYKALARPDFNHRLENYVARKQGTFYSGNSLIIGNPNLKAAKAWNFELNTSVFNNKIGLFSVSAFYKDIKDMYHLMDELAFRKGTDIDTLGFGDIGYDVPASWKDIDFILTYPYNSKKPTYVWGLEIEHQTNLRFLPGLLSNIVLSYNLSFIRSETYIPSTRSVEFEKDVGLPWKIKDYTYVLEQKKQKLPGQPEFFGNFAIGYDIGGFSARLSMFHQGEFNETFSADRRTDTAQIAFTRWDLAVKYELTRNISLMMNLNNLTNIEEGTSIINRVTGWNLINETEKYGLSGDIGLRITL